MPERTGNNPNNIDYQADPAGAVDQLMGENPPYIPIDEQQDFVDLRDQPPVRPDREPALEAQILRARMMRDDPAVRTAMTVVRRTPDIWQEVQPVLARREELIAGTQQEGERHRNFAPLLAGVALSDRGRALMDVAMDRAFEAQTDWLKAEVRDGNNYVHRLVVGSGPHSAIINSAMMARQPGHPALVVEKEEYVGGQFASPGAAAFKLNSRTRPENIDLPHRPGTEGSLNTQEMGVVQQSDITGLAYASQDTLAMPVRMNHMMASRVMTSSEVVSLDRNLADGSGRYDVTLKDPVTGEVMTVLTDQIIFTSGLGESKALADSNRRTQRIIKQEREKQASGGRAQVITAEELNEMMGDPNDPFPFRGIDSLVFVAPKDSAKVGIEGVLGYGPQIAKTVAQLDRVQRVTWVGQDAETKEEFERRERQRYRDLGLEFPREGKPDYYHRIDPVKGRAVSLERDEQTGEVSLVYREPDGTIGSVTGDLIVLATGFEDKTDEVLSGLNEIGGFVGPEEVQKDPQRVFAAAGSAVYFRDGIALYVNSVRKNPNGITVFDYVENGDDREVGECSLAEAGALLDRISRKHSGVSEAYINFQDSSAREIVRDKDREPIAQKLFNEDIYFAGPASRLEVTEKERREIPVLDEITENTAAVFRFGPKTTALANKLMDEDGPELPQDLVATAPESTGTVLPPLETPGGEPKEYKIDFSEHRRREKVPYNAVIEDLLRFAVGERLFSYRVPDDTPDLELTLQHASDESYRVSETHNALADDEYREMVRHVLADPVVQQMVERLTSKSATTSRKAAITIPFRDNKVDVEGIVGRSVRERREVVQEL